MPTESQWNLEHIPPKGHKDVAEFAYSLFDIAWQDRERLGKPKDFLNNYALYRGKQSLGVQTVHKMHTPVNLYFANIERTVSNITAREPTGEVVDLDGIKDGAEDIFSVKLKKWWKDTHQQSKTRATARTMEIYGITPEKPYWDKDRKEPNISILDPFAFLPAPGLYEDIATEAPFVCFAYIGFVDTVEAEFGVKGIAAEDGYELLGMEREKYRADNYATEQKLGNYADNMYRVNREGNTSADAKVERCLIIEVWVRDRRTRTTREELPVIDEASGGILLDEATGLPIMEQISTKEQVYPDGVRKITITRKKPDKKDGDSGHGAYMVLDDSANPNVNPALELPIAEQTYPWGRFPVYAANSYRDLVSIWGFSAAEQVGDLIVKINRILTKLIAYVINVMAPPLIIQQHCGISRSMVESALEKAGRLVLMPTTPTARIEFMQVPNLPATFFQVLDLIIRLFDRVYQIEDADRGEAPKGVIAASAIVALQERNQVMMQAKTSAIDSLAEQRARWAIGLWQNFGVEEELVEVSDEAVPVIPALHAGRKFSFVVEAGSTTPRTSLQLQEMAQALYQAGAIDRRALLENINFPGWQQVIERMGETQLDQALQVLIAAGLPEEEAMALREFLMQTQGGPGDAQQPGGNGGNGGGGTTGQVQKVPPPKAAQGKQPPAEVVGG